MVSSSLRIMVMVVLVTSSPLAYSQDPKDEKAPSEGMVLAVKQITTFEKKAELEGEVSFLQAENRRLDSLLNNPPQLARRLNALKAMAARPQILNALVDNGPALQAMVKALGDQMREKTSTLTKEWKPIQAQVLPQLQLLRDSKANTSITGQLAWTLSFDNRWFWLFGGLILLTIVGIAIHDRRQEIRKLIHGGRGRALRAAKIVAGVVVLFVVITIIIFLSGDSLYENVLAATGGAGPAPVKVLKEETEKLETQMADLQQKKAQLEEEQKKKIGLLKSKIPNWFPDHLLQGQQLVQQELDFANERKKTAIAFFVHKAVTDAVNSAVERSAELHQQILDSRTELASLKKSRERTRFLLGTFFIGCGALGGFLLYRSSRRQKIKRSRTCPMCGEEGKLRSVGSSARNDAMRMVQCDNVIRNTATHEERCNFTFLETYREQAKLCFPTLGHPRSGKTFWLAMVYRELNRGRKPKNVEFEKVKSTAADEFDRIVDDILHHRLGTAATQTDRLPHPLIFNFLDNDRWGRASPLVSIFDYAGEISTKRDVFDQHRYRALQAEGYVFFLDPTLPSEPQTKALVNFREDLRIVKKVKTGRRLRVPVALCLSKIDLLVTQQYAEKGERGPIARFYKELKKIDPTGSGMTLDIIEARSKLTSQLCKAIWPGWEIQEQIEGLFGNRFLFFPLSPVGMQNIGETDLGKRTIAPYAILEPLLWLLHMNGYPVL